MTKPFDGSWWRSAVIYEIYLRSFADGNGDGVGDLAGVRARLPYLADLGVDAIWFTPWYPSPLADGGYDVADYRSDRPGLRHPRRRRGAHRRGPRAGHPHDRRRGARTTSRSAHPWFTEALASRPGLPGPPPLLVPSRSWAGRLASRPTTWRVELRRPDLDPGHASGRAAGGVVPAPVHPRAAGPQLGPPRGPRRARRRAALLARPRRRRCADRRRARAARQGPGPARGAGRPAPRSPHPHEDRDELHEIYRRGARSPTPTDRPGAHRRGVAGRSRAVRQVPAPRTSCTPPSTSTYIARPWDAGGSARVDRRDTRLAPRRWAPPPPGCCPTTTSRGR